MIKVIKGSNLSGIEETINQFISTKPNSEVNIYPFISNNTVSKVEYFATINYEEKEIKEKTQIDTSDVKLNSIINKLFESENIYRILYQEEIDYLREGLDEIFEKAWKYEDCSK